MIITFSLEDDVGIRQVYSTKGYEDSVCWPEIIDQFNCFLAAAGYIAKKYNCFVEEIE